MFTTNINTSRHQCKLSPESASNGEEICLDDARSIKRQSLFLFDEFNRLEVRLSRSMLKLARREYCRPSKSSTRCTESLSAPGRFKKGDEKRRFQGRLGRENSVMKNERDTNWSRGVSLLLFLMSFVLTYVKPGCIQSIAQSIS